MKRLLVAAVSLLCLGSLAVADYGVIDQGAWPKSWPTELEPLRKQARTLTGPMVDNRHYAIGFSDREQFEAAWPHLLKVRSKGTTIRLTRAGKNFYLGDSEAAGVILHCPPKEDEQSQADHQDLNNNREGYKALHLKANYLEIVVDGNIVDLNRIGFPEETTIVDERFAKEPEVNATK